MTETVINVNGKQCDLSKALPLKLKDYKGMMTQGINLTKIESDNLMQIRYLEYIVVKGNPEITIDDIGELTLEQFRDYSILIQTLSIQQVDGPLDAG